MSLSTSESDATWWIVTSGNKGVNSSNGELSISFIIFNTRSKFIAMLYQDPRGVEKDLVIKQTGNKMSEKDYDNLENLM
jgi:hypothetical protein